MQSYFDPLSPQTFEKRRLRDDATYIGVMMLALEGTTLVLGILLQFIVRIFPTDQQTFLLVYAAIYAAGMALPAVAVSLVTRRRHFPLSLSRSIRPSDAFFGILAAVGICMIANIAVNYIVLFFESVGVPEPEMPDYLQPTIPSLLLNLFVFAVLPALLEELVFRGYVLHALRPYGDWFAVTVSALLFGLMHGNIVQIPFALIVGIALGWLYVMTDNIWIPIAVHFINNGFSFLLQYCTIGMDDEKLGMINAFAIFALIAIGALSLMVLFARRSALLRRLPKKSSLSIGERMSALLSTPLFLVCLAAFVLLTVMDVLGSMG